MKHAKLSASAAHRWMKCPGSARLSEGAPRSVSEYAAQGTVAHSLAAAMIANPKLQFKCGDKAVEDGFTITIDQEMLDGVQMYVDMVREDQQPGDSVWTEVDLTPALSKLHPLLGGNADHIRYRPGTQELRVIDFKYGAGVMVSAVANEQLLTYALGAMMYINDIYRVKTVVSTIVQPRIESEEGRVRDSTFPGVEILEFAADLITAARATEDPNAPLVPGDEQCKWCPAKVTCPALAQNQLAVLASTFEVQTYNPQELATALDMIGPLEAKIKHLREFAFAEAEAGRFGPEHGWKLVAKRATRKWLDEKAMIEWVRTQGVSPFADPDLLSPAQMEKRIASFPKSQGIPKDGIKAFIESKSSGNTLVPVADDRPAINPLAIAAEFQTADNLLEFKSQ